MKADICVILGIEYPIIGGAMTGVSDPKLTAAISEAGALGVYASGMHTTDIGYVREEIQELKHITKKPFGVNVAMVSPIINEIMQLLCKEEVAAVTTGAGSPAPYMPMLHEAGITVLPVIASPRHAIKMSEIGATALIAEGMESGGNAGTMSTMPLIPAVVDCTSLPIIAAGGIVDGRGMAAAFALGACGVQMGTRFMLSKESGISESTKDFLLSCDGSNTLVLGQHIGNRINPRVVMSSGVQKVLDYESAPGRTIEEYRNFIRGKSHIGTMIGDLENGYVSAGMGISAITEILSCKEIVENTMREFHNICASFGSKNT